jgi:hypothetical protein
MIMDTIEVFGSQMAYSQTGEGDAVVFLRIRAGFETPVSTFRGPPPSRHVHRTRFDPVNFSITVILQNPGAYGRAHGHTAPGRFPPAAIAHRQADARKAQQWWGNEPHGRSRTPKECE